VKPKPKPKRKVSTQSDLARVLGVSRQLISKHAKNKSAPPISDVGAWDAFLAERGRQGSAPPELRQQIAAERLAILKETKRGLQRQNSVADGKMIDRDLVKREVQHVMAFLFSDADRLLLTELPPVLKGLDEIGIRNQLEKAIGEFKADLKAKFEAIGEKETM